MEIKTLAEAKGILDKFSKLENATPFHTYEWLSALESLGAECKVVIFENSSAIFPFFQKKVGLIKINFSPIFGTETAYLGLLSKSPATDMQLKELEQKIGRFFMILPPNLSTKFGISESADTIITKFDKPNAQEHFKTLEKGHRYCTNKAEKEGVEVYEDYSDSAIDTYYNLLDKTYKENGYNPLPKEFYRRIILGLQEKNQIKLLFAKHNNETIACAAFPYIGKKIYYWTGASLKGDYAKLYPNNAIQWHLIKWAYSQGIKEYDMLGAGIEGIRNFKLGWGGEIVPYTRVYSSRMLKAMASAYSKIGSGLKGKIRNKIR